MNQFSPSDLLFFLSILLINQAVVLSQHFRPWPPANDWWNSGPWHSRFPPGRRGGTSDNINVQILDINREPNVRIGNRADLWRPTVDSHFPTSGVARPPSVQAVSDTGVPMSQTAVENSDNPVKSGLKNKNSSSTGTPKSHVSDTSPTAVPNHSDSNDPLGNSDSQARRVEQISNDMSISRNRFGGRVLNRPSTFSRTRFGPVPLSADNGRTKSEQVGSSRDTASLNTERERFGTEFVNRKTPSGTNASDNAFNARNRFGPRQNSNSRDRFGTRRNSNRASQISSTLGNKDTENSSGSSGTIVPSTFNGRDRFGPRPNLRDRFGPRPVFRDRFGPRPDSRDRFGPRPHLRDRFGPRPISTISSQSTSKVNSTGKNNNFGRSDSNGVPSTTVSRDRFGPRPDIRDRFGPRPDSNSSHKVDSRNKQNNLGSRDTSDVQSTIDSQDRFTPKHNLNTGSQLTDKVDTQIDTRTTPLLVTLHQEGPNSSHEHHIHLNNEPCDGKGGEVRDVTGKITHLIDQHDCSLLEVVDSDVTGGHAIDPHNHELLLALDSKSFVNPNTDHSQVVPNSGSSVSDPFIPDPHTRNHVDPLDIHTVNEGIGQAIPVSGPVIPMPVSGPVIPDPHAINPVDPLDVRTVNEGIGQAIPVSGPIIPVPVSGPVIPDPHATNPVDSFDVRTVNEGIGQAIPVSGPIIPIPVSGPVIPDPHTIHPVDPLDVRTVNEGIGQAIPVSGPVIPIPVSGQVIPDPNTINPIDPLDVRTVNEGIGQAIPVSGPIIPIPVSGPVIPDPNTINPIDPLDVRTVNEGMGQVIPVSGPIIPIPVSGPVIPDHHTGDPTDPLGDAFPVVGPGLQSRLPTSDQTNIALLEAENKRLERRLAKAERRRLRKEKRKREMEKMKLRIRELEQAAGIAPSTSNFTDILNTDISRSKTSNDAPIKKKVMRKLKGKKQSKKAKRKHQTVPSTKTITTTTAATTTTTTPNPMKAPKKQNKLSDILRPLSQLLGQSLNVQGLENPQNILGSLLGNKAPQNILNSLLGVNRPSRFPIPRRSMCRLSPWQLHELRRQRAMGYDPFWGRGC